MKNKLLLYFLLLFSFDFAIAQQWTWFHSDNSGLPSNTVVSLSVNDSAIVYAGTISGLGKFKNNIWTKLSVGPNTSPAILRVHADSNKVFVGTEFDGLWDLTSILHSQFSAGCSLYSFIILH